MYATWTWSLLVLLLVTPAAAGPRDATSQARTAEEPRSEPEARAEAGKASFIDHLTVLAASRRRQRVVDAPAAVTVLPQPEIERESAGGQLPKLLEFTLGTELTQGSLYEFNLNVRGVNDVFNRRLLVLIDGRDAALPSLGSQEWAALPFPLDDLASVELVRGPGSALYGSDAFSGVLNLVTKDPRLSQDGRVRLSGGELSSGRLDLRYASGLGAGWYMKAVGGAGRSEDFSRARTSSVEYSRPCTALGEAGCLPLEAVPPELDRDRFGFGSLRLDKHFGDRASLVIEGGTALFDGPVAVTEFGRFQLLDVERPWARVNFNTSHWNVLGYHTGRQGDEQRFLTNAYPFSTESYRNSVEVQGHTGFAKGRGYVIAGVSAAEEMLDSAGPDGRQTVTFRRRHEDFQALFGQLEYQLSDRLKGVVAARWDEASFHDGRLSPRASLVYALKPSQNLRLSFSEAFLSPSYVQLVIYMPAAPPLDLSPFESICALGGVACGFDRPLAIRAVGNEDVEPEEIRSLELGYSGALGDRLFVTATAYHNRVDHFISDFLPYARPGGRLHDGFAAWAPPAGLAPPLATLLLGSLQAALPPELFAALSAGVDGEPFFPLLSVVNFGRVDTRGLELGATRRLGDRWTLDAGYSFFDFDVRERLFEDPALPNAPEHKLHAGLTFVDERLDAALKVRWVDGFPWSAGVFRGDVPSYEVADLTANYRLDDRWSVGVDVSNLFDSSHYELFGADLLERRALLHVTAGW